MKIIIAKGEVLRLLKNDFNFTYDTKSIYRTAKQCCIPLANVMTSAATIGIESSPIVGFNQEIHNRILIEDLGIHTLLSSISYLIAFGYRVNEASTKNRRNITTYTPNK